MNFEQLQEYQLPILHQLLAERLKHSREWGNVKVTTGKRHLEIKWFEPKTQKGKDVFSSRRVAPFNACTLLAEIKRQFYKLQEEAR